MTEDIVKQCFSKETTKNVILAMMIKQYATACGCLQVG